MCGVMARSLRSFLFNFDRCFSDFRPPWSVQICNKKGAITSPPDAVLIAPSTCRSKPCPLRRGRVHHLLRDSAAIAGIGRHVTKLKRRGLLPMKTADRRVMQLMPARGEIHFGAIECVGVEIVETAHGPNR